jgi:hypothetical protein
MADDCLLQVASTGWSERYKRFYYSDIRAIVIRRTTTTITILNVLLVVLTVLTTITALTLSQPAFFLITVLFMAPLLYNLLVGPTCVCHIYTSVQVERLPSLGRVRTARKVIARLRPMIEQAQGQLEAAPVEPSA